VIENNALNGGAPNWKSALSIASSDIEARAFCSRRTYSTMPAKSLIGTAGSASKTFLLKIEQQNEHNSEDRQISKTN